jgi:hypothetical protein
LAYKLANKNIRVLFFKAELVLGKSKFSILL